MKQFVFAVLTRLSLGAMVMATGVAHAEVVVVGSKQIPFTQISKTKLRDLYTGQSQLVGDAKVLVIDREDTFDRREQFISRTLGFTSEEFATVQRLMECIGISKAPTVADNSQHMVEMLSNNPNALGYLSRDELENHPLGAKLQHIKVLAE
ncbi:hypothetical protein [Limnobacter parvus]|uniref:Phosphate ABC transporter substrate-binding protein n=1 Tax=Limnobacter parvus TaxID=2939690 RepID=A0ABT1XMP5_9BURK|nr:hypothetical protein [Limnobacter parvus]MCR2747364.1 hypothetical protein [Limnobacter parvus]